MNRPGAETSRILVVDDHVSARQSVIDALMVNGYEVAGCDSGKAALRWLEDHQASLIVTDLMMPGMDGVEFLRTLRERRYTTQVVMMTAHGSVQTAVEAMRYGAYDYLEKPFGLEQLESVVAGALGQAARGGLRSEICSPDETDLLLGDSPAMQRLKQQIQQVAMTDVTVLVTGESGTGKELVARSLHQASLRREQPLVSLNCPALSPQLMESELFGHERGAFTNAHQPRVGRFELADRGTIFLDEITELELSVQAKLLRVLQERSFERVGSNKTRSVDVRVVAATNRNLQAEVQQGRFREDLYFRLAVIPLVIPPLRQRGDDVILLARHFLAAAAERCGRPKCRLSGSAERWLREQSWPGNVRELENLMTRSTVLATSDEVDLDTLQAGSLWSAEATPDGMIAGTIGLGEEQESSEQETSWQESSALLPGTGMKLADAERQWIEATLEQFDGHRELTAKALGIGVRTLANKLKAYGYSPREKSFQRKSGTRAA